MSNKKIPVTVLSGYLGAGKTTILNHVLNNQEGLKVAIIVNDMSEINVDADLVRNAGVSRTEEKLVELSNGCICCTLREDLLLEVEKLAKQGDVDYIIIESTGISEPIPVAQTFSYIDEELGIDLTRFCELDTMVTVVDANRFWQDFSSGESLLDRKEALGEEDRREVVDLIIDQIEFCDVLLLNKTDLVEEASLDELEQVLKKLQPSAQIIRTAQGKVNPNQILHTGLFDFEKALNAPGWLQELQKEEHTPETQEYGISSFVYRRQRPFHPERLHLWMEDWPDEIVRAKGIIWLASRNDMAILISQAGTSIGFEPAAYWVGALSYQEQQAILKEEPDLERKWHPVFGDRMTEFVLIGIDLNQHQVESSLNQCLLTDEEMNQNWNDFNDRFPAFVEVGQLTN